MSARILKVRIENFRCFRRLEFFPETINVIVGPNNVGKTALLEGLFMTLGTEARYIPNLVCEYDFYQKRYVLDAALRTDDGMAGTEDGGQQEQGGVDATSSVEPDGELPRLLIELTVGPLETLEEKRPFRNYLEAWDAGEKRIVPLHDDPSALDHYANCIRVAFVAWYDQEGDDFEWRTVFVGGDDAIPLEERTPISSDRKREIGFLMYREQRGSTRPLTLAPQHLFHKLLAAYEAKPHTYEHLLRALEGTGDRLHEDAEFDQIVRDYERELQQFLPFRCATSSLRFDVTNLTRVMVRQATQAFVRTKTPSLRLPLEVHGAGTRSMAVLAMLTLVARKRGHAIVAVEEPETFLYPASQRAVVGKLKELATQLFITTHSPYVLDLFQPQEIAVLRLGDEGEAEIARPCVTGVKEAKRYDRLFRAGLSEAILSHGALIAEGQSEAPLIRGFAEIAAAASGEPYQVNLDTSGIAVVGAQGITEQPVVARFLAELGVRCFIVHDRTSDRAIVAEMENCNAGRFELPYEGIEAMLSAELPRCVLEKLWTWATNTRGVKRPPLCDTSAVSEEELRKVCEKLLADNKNLPPMYSRIVQACAVQRFVPPTVQSLFAHLAAWGAGRSAGDPM